ncbi:MAG: peptide chain release factor N(5)-glutamine methyltransferase [Planctomycetota bacterium]|nr:peptide chain release factor N(5)-glutamine methyltransferase [Planctomycetota bacterium]
MTQEPWTVRTMRAWLRKDLESRGVPASPLCADLLLAHVMGVTRTALYMRPVDEVLEPVSLERIRELVARLRKREPIQYVVGSWHFHGIQLDVNTSTLIPRPATETLVEQALSVVKSWDPIEHHAVLDIGTGTGCIPIALAVALRGRRDRGHILPWNQDPTPTVQVALEVEPAVRFVATDVSAEAIELASKNAESNRVEAAIQFRLGSVWVPIADGERFDLICSNPPYIADHEWDSLAAEVREHEPASALRGGADGLRFLKPIILGAPKRLRPRGTLIVEFGTNQAAAVSALATTAGLTEVSIEKDGDGLERVLVARGLPAPEVTPAQVEAN